MNLFLDTADYRDLLKSYYERRKKEMPLYSYRMMGEKLGLDSSFLFRGLQKNHHLPVHALQKAKEKLASEKLSLMDAHIWPWAARKRLWQCEISESRR